MNICSVEDCTRRVLAKGLCNSHYQSQRATAIRQKNAVVRQCQVCGNDYLSSDPRKRFCSKACKERSRNTGPRPNEKFCLSCFEPLSGKRVDAKYCDEKCGHDYINNRRSRERLAEKQSRPSCPCGKPIPPELKNTKIYCSEKCKIDAQHDRRRFDEYGITKQERQEMFEAQEHRCAICGEEQSGRGSSASLHTDHIHGTKIVREGLCSRCNNMIGRAEKQTASPMNPAEILRAAADYYEYHQRLNGLPL